MNPVEPRLRRQTSVVLVRALARSAAPPRSTAPPHDSPPLGVTFVGQGGQTETRASLLSQVDHAGRSRRSAVREPNAPLWSWRAGNRRSVKLYRIERVIFGRTCVGHVMSWLNKIAEHHVSVSGDRY